jgi:hypothetical protein
VIAPPLAHHHGVRSAVIWVAVALTLYTGRAVSARRPAGVQGGVAGRRPMRIEIVAVGTELLLGQIADTNSAWLGEQLAAAAG